MKIIAIGSQKGGVGKSTISIHLAAAFAGVGRSVILADLDPHSRTATEWASMRVAETPLVVQVEPAQLPGLVLASRDQNTEFLFLDLPPYVDETTREAARIADLVLIPARPSFPDLRSLPRILSQIGSEHTVILNACHPGQAPFESGKTREARAVLERADIAVCPVSIAQRVAFTDALNDGRAVDEFDSKSKASQEIKKLTNWVQQHLEA